MKFITTTEDQVSINLPRWAKQARDNFVRRMDVSYKLDFMQQYCKSLEGALDDMVKTYGDDVRCRAIMKKHGLSETK